MSVSLNLRGFLVALLFGSSTLAIAQGRTDPPVWAPQSGQVGKDVVWVPTPDGVISQMLRMANVTPKDLVYDLGTGDGKVAIAAAKIGAHSVGVAYSPDVVQTVQANFLKEGVSDRAHVRYGNVFTTDLSQATVVTLHLLPALNLKLRPNLLTMRPGTRIVSHGFGMDDWGPDEKVTLTAGAACPTAPCNLYMWIVPAQVAGNYKVTWGDVALTQRFQILSGTLRTAEGTVSAIEGRVRGHEVTLTAGGKRYSGRVTGNQLEMFVSPPDRNPVRPPPKKG